MKLGEIDGVKFLAWKSGGVKFLTNSMSEGVILTTLSFKSGRKKRRSSTKRKDRQIFRWGHYHPFVFSILQIGVKRQMQEIFPTRIPIVDILFNRITTYKLTLWQNSSHLDIIVELLWRLQNPQIPGRKPHPSSAPFPHSSFKGVFMKALHNPLEFNNLLSQRVNDGNMRKAPWKDFYLQIMVNPRWPILSFSLSCY